MDGGTDMTAVAAVLGAVVLAVLDAAIANVALPTIAQSLQVSPGASVWIITAYQAALVMGLLPCAALGESWGYRRVFTGGVALFTMASALCAFAPSLPWLVAARLLQGLGGSAVMALSIALLRQQVPHRKLAAAIGWNALAVALSSAAGPMIGAAILVAGSWPWLFALNLPLGALVLLASRALPAVPGTARRLDRLSVAINAVAFAALVLGAEAVILAPALAAALVAAATLCVVALVRREMPKAAPLIPLDLLRSDSFRISVIASVCCFTGVTIGLLALPFYLQHGSRPGHSDGGALHDALATDGGICGAPGRPPCRSHVDGDALRRRRRVSDGWLGRCLALACERRPVAAGSDHDAVRPWLWPVPGAQQSQHVPVGPAGKKRRRRRHAGHGTVDGADRGWRDHELALRPRID